MAIEIVKNHRPCYIKERKHIKPLACYIDDGYLNGQLDVAQALGDWHIEGTKESSQAGGTLIAEPELKMITLTKGDEFLIIDSYGIWVVFSNQNAVETLPGGGSKEHNDVKMCCKELVEEAARRGAADNLTIVMVCFHSEPPARIMTHRSRI